MPEVLWDTPRRRGRPLSTDISEHKAMADANPGRWVSETYTQSSAMSARRQFLRAGYQVMTAKNETPGMRDVMVKS